MFSNERKPPFEYKRWLVPKMNRKEQYGERIPVTVDSEDLSILQINHQTTRMNDASILNENAMQDEQNTLKYLEQEDPEPSQLRNKRDASRIKQGDFAFSKG
ncbi:unnamed protein product [Lepeophtheirus salmonis]|uniref:(salmon louse) hypothetical protein n=1 Tax=Lepeophtheirus salmonis TaxID=72036 RepID=A0A7R8CNZ3_LEPSM|nr:unnamed protein product [Lepeophtheirus salmonis]CAF2849272.1 unnamed protein product [Lepeophtheirus salmonis]